MILNFVCEDWTYNVLVRLWFRAFIIMCAFRLQETIPGVEQLTVCHVSCMIFNGLAIFELSSA